MRLIKDRPRRIGSCSLLTIFLVITIFFLHSSVAQVDAEYDYVREVLDEDELHSSDHDSAHMDERDYESYQERTRRKLEEEELRLQAEEERRAREKAERVQREREAAFEAELKQMAEEEQKKARKQKRKDAKIVRSVLRAAKRENYYAVLGLRNWEIRIPSRSVKIAGAGFTIPGFKLFHISQKAIRRAYRRLANTVHPDKNRDGRAEEAFIAVENAASILSDESTRAEYDELITEVQRRRREEHAANVRDAIDGIFRLIRRIIAIFRRILGPFGVPVLILGVLIA